MDAIKVADTLALIIATAEANGFDGPVGRAELVRRLAALKREVFPYEAEYYAIVGRHTGKVIGVCHRSGIPDVLAEEPLATFTPISRDEYVGGALGQGKD